MVAKLYLIERSAKDMTPEERREIRQSQAKPLLDKIKSWLDSKASKVLPKSLLGKAIQYTLNLWPQLIIYVEDGDIPVDNNPAENAVRSFVIEEKTGSSVAVHEGRTPAPRSIR